MACKLLLVVALGRLFLERGASSSGPPGIREFLQGADLPSTLVLRQDPVIALETLCMLAIYAQAADMHEVACLHVSILYL
jgi:proline utilization trans-activator